jgi:hypothetical protein
VRRIAARQSGRDARRSPRAVRGAPPHAVAGTASAHGEGGSSQEAEAQNTDDLLVRINGALTPYYN